jgi:hypothetical protein
MIIEYPISANYCKSWTIKEAIRELIANARDEGEHFVSWDNGTACIQDFGKGIPKHYFVLGEGENKSGTQIGQFREGLKIAGLVMAREGRKIKGQTLKYTFEFTMGVSKAFDCPVVMLDLNEVDKPVIGTIINFDCTEAELNETKDLFLDPDIASAESLLSSDDMKGSLYINGVFVQTVNSMFGYNILDKSAANRDRSILDTNAVNKAISRVWQANSDETTIKKILESKEQYLEHDVDIVPPSHMECNDIWRKVVALLYGEKCCITDDKAHIAKDRGWAIITPLTWNLKWNLNYHLKIPYAKEVLAQKEDLDLTNIFSTLDRKTQMMISQAKQIAENVVGEKLQVEIVKTLSLEDDNTLSSYTPKDKTVRVAQHMLDRGFEFLVGALIHEGIHQTSGADDSSAEFEWAMTMAFGKTAARGAGVYFRGN